MNKLWKTILIPIMTLMIVGLAFGAVEYAKKDQYTLRETETKIDVKEYDFSNIKDTITSLQTSLDKQVSDCNTEIQSINDSLNVYLKRLTEANKLGLVDKPVDPNFIG